MKNIFTMGKSMIIFAFVNCPWVKNQSSRFTIDNNFFGSTYRAARYLTLRLPYETSNIFHAIQKTDVININILITTVFWIA